MATYYVGLGGNDGNTGLSWAQRFLTLNGAEDEPVVAGDIVYVAPGVYREMLTVDVSGGAANEIVYIGDVTGEHTDSIGGVVRVTGSDNDTTTNRAQCITGTGFDYRIFRGFTFDGGATYQAYLDNCESWTIEDCCFRGSGSSSANLRINGPDQVDNTIRRCLFLGVSFGGIDFRNGAEVLDCNSLVENCAIIGCRDDAVHCQEVFGVTVRNCLIMGSADGVDSNTASIGAVTPVHVENCHLIACVSTALESAVVGDLTEDYNNLIGNGGDYSNVTPGANSQGYIHLLGTPILHAGASQASGFKFPWMVGALSEWSALDAITGANEPSDDFFGMDRPATAAKNSWGPIQFHDTEREIGTVRTGSVSIALHDAAIHQIWVPTANESTTISVYAYREANYAGTNPRLIVKQPGQADDVTTDAAAASQWNELTTTLTPAADPPYVVVELQSLNTAAAGNYDTFFDDLTVS